jgi:hypothetical protein
VVVEIQLVVQVAQEVVVLVAQTMLALLAQQILVAVVAVELALLRGRKVVLAVLVLSFFLI